MNIEDKIAELLAQAEPLRKLADDDTAKAPLTGIVDEINALRAEQSRGGRPDPDESRELMEVKRGIENTYGRKPNPGEAEFFLNKPKRGRPAKVEGDDA